MMCLILLLAFACGVLNEDTRELAVNVLLLACIAVMLYYALGGVLLLWAMRSKMGFVAFSMLSAWRWWGCGASSCWF